MQALVGFAGMLDLGFVAFYALGTYAIGWLASTQFDQMTLTFGSTATSLSREEVPGIHVSFWILLFVAAAFAGLCAVIIGAPTLRLRGDYLTIVTLGLGEIIPRFFQNGDNLGDFNLTNGTADARHRPLLDEPSMGLAPGINQQRSTNLLVEQNANVALEIATRCYVLESGSIVNPASAEMLREDPNVREAYLGEM
jgi:ABC-type branched-subunit amino acid transport system permease subunit